ncbi:MAG: pseudouridine synthase [bacterium]|nr:pseudouridine synthase [bacterium]
MTEAFVRLNKFISSNGISSRRKIDEMIEQGRVSVNGNTITELGFKIDPGSDKVALDGEIIKVSTKKIYLILNKPKGVITSVSDDKHRTTVIDIINLKEKIFPVGRLDYSTSGLLLLTNDGELANKLMHPKSEIYKTYFVTLSKPLEEKHRLKLEGGVKLEGKKTAECHIRFPKKTDYSTLYISIYEGRNRQVRNMFEHYGYFVRELERTEYAGLKLDTMKEGEWRNLTADELSLLEKITKSVPTVSTSEIAHSENLKRKLKKYGDKEGRTYVKKDHKKFERRGDRENVKRDFKKTDSREEQIDAKEDFKKPDDRSGGEDVKRDFKKYDKPEGRSGSGTGFKKYGKTTDDRKSASKSPRKSTDGGFKKYEKSGDEKEGAKRVYKKFESRDDDRGAKRSFRKNDKPGERKDPRGGFKKYDKREEGSTGKTEFKKFDRRDDGKGGKRDYKKSGPGESKFGKPGFKKFDPRGKKKETKWGFKKKQEDERDTRLGFAKPEKRIDSSEGKKEYNKFERRDDRKDSNKDFKKRGSGSGNKFGKPGFKKFDPRKKK